LEAEGLTDDDGRDFSDADSLPEALGTSHASAEHHAFIFGFRSANVDLRPLHPLPSQIPFIWSVYLQNVDPVIKVLHTPSMTKLVSEISVNRNSLTPPVEALMFAIYYAAITSMEDDEVSTNFGLDRPALAARYRFATEQALAKANFLVSSDIVTCQAFLLLLQLVRRHEETRLAWTLTGLACRIAQSLGLHRDGTNFPNLTPFEVEMRRRLFWAISILDLRSAEDQGTDLVLVDRFCDTKMPLNINDTDFGPDSTDLPEPRNGATDMTFSVIRYETCAFGRRMYAAAGASAVNCPGQQAGTLAEQEQALRGLHDRIAFSYLRDNSGELDPIYWVAATLARIIIAKMTLVIYQPLITPGPGQDELSAERRQRLTMAAIEMFEYQQRLNSDARSKPWRWLFQTYILWHAMAYLLLECSHSAWTATMERAWIAVNGALRIARAHDLARLTDHTAVWMPLRKLFAKVRKHRSAEIARLKANPGAAAALDAEVEARPAPSSFSSLPGSIKSAVALERWRKLVDLPSNVEIRGIPPGLAASSTLPDGDESAKAAQALLARMDAAQLPRANGAESDTTAMLDEMMSQPTFSPDEIMAMAWDGSANIGMISGDIGLVNAAAIPPTSSSYMSSSVPAAKPVAVSGSSTSTALDQATSGSFDDNPPPYLWSRPGDASQSYEGDANMEEGFDWQNWQQNLTKTFETAGGPGLSSGMWGGEI
jgi:hypothetical protein